MAKKKKNRAEDRNPLVIVMATHSYGAGPHKKNKGEVNRKACRGKHNWDGEY